MDALGAISQAEPPVVTRVVFTEADIRGRDFVKNLCREAGLSVREDAVGNTFARWAGANPELEPVATGSHIDAIPNAGRFDGTVGVLGGLEAIRALARAGYQPRRSIELIIFTSEEPTRFGIGCLGSRLLWWSPRPRLRQARDWIAMASRSIMLDGRPVSRVHWPRCPCRRDIIRPSLKCTSNKDRCWSGTTSR